MSDFTELKKEDLLELKSETFYYCKKKYTAKRLIDINKRVLITSDNGFRYVSLYIANEDGLGKFVSDIYHENNPNSYPIYSIDDAITKFNEFKIATPNVFKIHDSHYKAIRNKSNKK